MCANEIQLKYKCAAYRSTVHSAFWGAASGNGWSKQEPFESSAQLDFCVMAAAIALSVGSRLADVIFRWQLIFAVIHALLACPIRMTSPMNYYRTFWKKLRRFFFLRISLSASSVQTNAIK